MGLVHLPKFTIFYHKNQPNLGNIPYMDPMGKQLSVRICLLQRDIPVTCHNPRNFPGNRIFIRRKAPITCGEYSSPVRSYMKRQSSNQTPIQTCWVGKVSRGHAQVFGELASQQKFLSWYKRKAEKADAQVFPLKTSMTQRLASRDLLFKRIWQNSIFIIFLLISWLEASMTI